MTTRQRAQANMSVVVLSLFGTIIAAALVYVMLDQAWTPIIDMAADNASLSAASTGIAMAKEGWANWAWFVIVLIAIMGITGAAAVRGRAR